MNLILNEKVETNRVKLEFSVDKETFAKAIDKAYRKMVKTMNIQGFRKGKAPKSIVEKMYGESVFYDEALNDIFPDAYTDAFKEAGINPVAYPEADVKSVSKEDGVVFVATVAVKPEIELSAYKGLKAKKLDDKVSDKEIQSELEAMQRSQARTVTVSDRAAKDGDIVVIAFEGFMDGVAFEGGKGEGTTITLGEGQFIPGFEEQIAGKKTDEEFDINISFPEDYPAEELAGKPAVFKTKLYEIRCKEYPEIDDEFAKDVDEEVNTLAELKEKITVKIKEGKAQESRTNIERDLYHALSESVTAEIPHEMIDATINQMYKEFEQNLMSQGMEAKDFFKYTGMTEKGMRESMSEGALQRVKVDLAVDKIIELENLEATPQDIEDEYKKYSEVYQMEVDVIKTLVPEADLVIDITRRRAFDLITDNAVIELAGEEKAEAEETEEATEKKPKAKAAKAAKSEDATEEKKPVKKRTKKAEKTEEEQQ